MIRRVFLMLAALAVVFGAIFGYKFWMATRGGMRGGVPVVSVTAAPATAEVWYPQLSSVGHLRAVAGVDLNNELQGRVTAIHFHSGDFVDENAPLIDLDTSVDIAELARLEAERDLADVELRRQRNLLTNKATSQAAADAAVAAHKAAQARVAAQQALIRKKKLRAPFAGRLGIRRVDIGEYLPAGRTIVTLQTLDPIYLDFALPQHAVPQVETGQPVTATIDAWPDRGFQGEIESIDPKVNATTGSFYVRAILDNPEQMLLPGMFAQVAVELPAQDNVVTVPQTAVTYNPYGETVYVITGTRTESGDTQLMAKRRFVRAGGTRGDQVAITSGLEAGEQVVTTGQVKLRDNSPVIIDNERTPANEANPKPREP